MSGDEIKTAVDAYLKEIGFTFEAVYVGKTKRDENWECFEWRITLKSASETMEQPYYRGLAHRHMKKGAMPPPKGVNKNTLYYVEWEERNTVPTPPTAAEVLYSLMLDGEAINESFSDWCANYGYDDDSIKALNMYRTCEEIGRKLRKVFTYEQRERLRELAQDL